MTKKNIYKFIVDYCTDDIYVISEDASGAIEKLINALKDKQITSKNVCAMERVAEDIIF